MDLEKELRDIDAFFDSISDEEFTNMMEDCGAERILPTESIMKNQRMYLYDIYYPRTGNRKNCAFSEYIDYNDGIERSGAA